MSIVIDSVVYGLEVIRQIGTMIDWGTLWQVGFWRTFFVLGCLLAVAGCGGEIEPVEEQAAVWVEAGALYLKLEAAADALGLGVKDVEEGNPVVFKDNGFRIEVIPGQAAMRVNGVLVHTGLPALRRMGAVYVSTHDLKWVWQPLLADSKASSGSDRGDARKDRFTVFIDPGHGGQDPGAIGPHCRTKEKDLALEVGLELGRLLEKADVKVEYSRTDDSFIALTERGRLANESAADLFLSIHFNAAGNPEASGIEVFVLQPPGERTHPELPYFLRDRVFVSGHVNGPQSLLIASRLQESLLQRTEERDRGVRRARFLVLRDLNMPGVLLELGFLTHAPTAEKLSDPEYRRELALIISETVIDWAAGQPTLQE